jgi:predicted DNA-binding transcriptional regulator YafY
MDIAWRSRIFASLKLRRIRELSILDEAFNRKCPQKVITESPGGSEEPVEITLRISGEMAFRVYDEFNEL